MGDLWLQRFEFCSEVPSSVLKKVEKMMEKSGGVSRLRELRKLLKQYPDCPDLIMAQALTMSEVYEDQNELDFLEREFGRLVKKYSINLREPIPWSHPGNRPFLRMFFRIGQLYFEEGKFIACRNVFENLIGLNPSDEQGAKWYLMKCYLELEEYERLVEFTKLYPIESNVAVGMNRLLGLLKLGLTEEAEKLFEEIVNIYAIAMEYLVDGEPENLGFEPKAYISVGKTGAYMYFKHFYDYWDDDEVEFLRRRIDVIRDKAANIRAEIPEETFEIKEYTGEL